MATLHYKKVKSEKKYYGFFSRRQIGCDLVVKAPCDICGKCFDYSIFNGDYFGTTIHSNEFNENGTRNENLIFIKSPSTGKTYQICYTHTEKEIKKFYNR